ncbi:MAG: AGE family epimerase/isomerase [Cephaloticoccus sp.]|nr:AGE family epimerase/isomerase [Cephaloticoccus sp.]
MRTELLVEFARARLALLLEQWSQVAPREQRPWQVLHGPAWEPLDDTRATLVTQSRFVHNFAQGWRLTGDARWRELALAAVDGLLRCFPITPTGLPVFMVRADGTVVDDRVYPYGAAFVLLALAYAHELDPQARFTAAAETFWQALQPLRDAHGGWAWHHAANGQPEPGARTHNPIMHLVEACLTWQKWDGRWTARTTELLTFIKANVVQGGDEPFIPEFCDEQWRPWTQDDKEAGLSTGHQWEWAHLLIQGSLAGIPGADRTLARGLVAAGRRGMRGPDDLISRFKREGGVVHDRQLYWDYCEAARACLWLAAHGDQPDCLKLLPGLLRGLESRCYDPVNRGYITVGTMEPSTQNKGDLWRVDYHQVALFADIITLAPRLPPEFEGYFTPAAG